MTDDEIRAAIAAIPNSARFFPPNTTEIAIYRAGMRRAAQIAREHEFARTAAAAIERAAGGEG